jgi:dTDP-4-dehydrorhamnose 3,5-epimerase
MVARMCSLSIPEIRVLQSKAHRDDRGFFSELYSKRAFLALGIDIDFVQDNHSFSAARGTIRGLHFQAPPFAQSKLVQVLQGAVYDVAVDLRCGSPTYGRHVSTVLSAEEGNQLFIPVGFAHGLVTLESDTKVLYKVSNYYAPEYDTGLLWNDPDLEIAWPFPEAEAILSDRDRKWSRLRELPEIFFYGRMLKRQRREINRNGVDARRGGAELI